MIRKGLFFAAAATALLTAFSAVAEEAADTGTEYIRLEYNSGYSFTGSDPHGANSYKIGTDKYQQMFRKYGAQCAFDGDVNTAYVSQTDGKRKYIQVGLPAQSGYIVKRIGIIPRKGQNPALTNDVEIYGAKRGMSGNLKDAVLLTRISGIEKTDGTEYIFDVNDKNEEYTHFMLLAQKINTGSSVSLQIAEVRLYIENPDYVPEPEKEQLDGAEEIAVKNEKGILSGGFINDEKLGIVSAGLRLSNGRIYLPELPVIQGAPSVIYAVETGDTELTGENVFYGE